MRFLFSYLLPFVLAAGHASTAAESEAGHRPQVMVLIGAGGLPEFEREFSEWAFDWEKAAEKGEAELITLGPASPSGETVKEDFLRHMESLDPESPREFWLVLIGHGTFDGKTAKFNLAGPDISVEEVKGIFENWTRPLIFIDCSSSSAPFLAEMAGERRIVITSTRSGYEQNFSRFGGFFAEAIADPEADLDKDRQTSLLEAFLTTARRLNEFYEADNRLVTEHPLLEDNGDGKGTPADWFQGIRAVKKAADGSGLDGFRAHQIHLVLSELESQLTYEARKERDALELEIEALREQKSKLGEEAYYDSLEDLMLRLALIYEAAEIQEIEADPPSPEATPANNEVRLIPPPISDKPESK